MLDKLKQIWEVINNSDISKIKNVIMNNEYDEMKKYCCLAIAENSCDDIIYCYLGCVSYFVENDHDEAMKYYDLAIEKGSTDAILHLCFYYGIIEKNHKEAMKYHEMAIEKCNTNANLMYKLGMMYFIEEISSSERHCYEKAKKYYGLAVENGHVGAMVELGDIYYYRDINHEEAKKYYGMAVDKGDTNAMIKLAIYYENIEKNYEEAKKYYGLAIDKGNTNAQHDLNRLEKKINEISKIKIKEALSNVSSIKNVKQMQNNECVICKTEYNMTIGFNCLDKYNDHNYCQECAIKWYENETTQLKCVLCFSYIVPQNLSLNIKCQKIII